jgi:TatD DNase family protein
MSGIWDKLTDRLIDTHCHIHHYENPQKLIEKLNAQKIRVHLVTVKPQEYAECLVLTENSPLITPCIGMFPLLVKECQDMMPLFWEHLEKTKYVGEIGLDYSVRDAAELSLQKSVFEQIVNKCHEIGGKVLSIHSRRSAEDVLSIIGNSFNGTAIMHWYSGPVDLAIAAPDNVFFSINTAMLKSRQGKLIIRNVPREKILTETDGPYVKLDNKAVEPEDIRNVVNALSVHWRCTIEEALEIVTQNYQRALKS